MTDRPSQTSSSAAAAAVGAHLAAGQAEAAARGAEGAAEGAQAAAEIGRRSATASAAAARATKSAAERATELAADRTALAFERTYAAWVRTGLVALASGIGSPKLLDGLAPGALIHLTGATLLMFAAFCFVAAVWRLLARIESPAPDESYALPRGVFLFVNGLLALTAIAVLVGMYLAPAR